MFGPVYEEKRAIVDGETQLYKAWYLKMRIAEELNRASRFNVPLTLVIFQLSAGSIRSRNRRLLNELLRDMAVRKLRRYDVPAVLERNAYAILLNHTTSGQADRVIERLLKAFEPFSPSVGRASYPDDTDDPTQILLVAKHRALAQRNCAA